MSLPILAIPIGDPAGIGPEIALKAASNSKVQSNAHCILIGDLRVLERALSFPGMPQLELHPISSPDQADFHPKTINVIPVQNADPSYFSLGKITALCGRAAYEYISESVRLAISGAVQGVCTPPLNKESLRAGGIPYIGHTEIFAALTNTADPITMFQVRNLRIFFYTRHIPLSTVSPAITKDGIIHFAHRCLAMLRQLRVPSGTMAIAGFNPHCGEHGLFGAEEVFHITPAVETLQNEGLSVVGPIGADSVFHLALQGHYSSVLSLYHDQGHIAAKTLDFDRTVSVTGGMPILRTSVDHGTAFDIAGTGRASSVSMEEAILVASAYAPAFSRKV